MDGKVRSSPSLEALQYSPRASLRRSLQKRAAALYTASASLSSIKERPRNASRPIRVSEAGAAGGTSPVHAGGTCAERSDPDHAGTSEGDQAVRQPAPRRMMAIRLRAL